MSVLGKCLQINKSNLFAQSSRTLDLFYYYYPRKMSFQISRSSNKL